MDNDVGREMTMRTADPVHGRGASDVTDHRIALASSVLSHAALVLIFCWPVCRSHDGSGGHPAAGDGDVVVEFVSIARTADSQFAVEAVAQPVEAAVIEQDEQEMPPDPVLVEAPLPIADDDSDASTAAAASTTSAKDTAYGSGGGMDGDGDDLESRYLAALKAAIYAQWKPDERMRDHGECDVLIRQSEGGGVLTAQAENCGLSPSEQRALEAATLMAQPLPYAGYEPVFLAERAIKLEF